MRRKERMLSEEGIDNIIRHADILRLGLCDENKPYVVPLNYGYDGECFYVHCALEGKKLDIIQKNPNVCIEIEGKHELSEGETACQYTMKYESVIGFGHAEILRDKSDVIKGLDILMKQFSDRAFTYNDKIVDCFCLTDLSLPRLLLLSCTY